MEAGQTRTYDIADYLEAGVADPEPNDRLGAEHRQRRCAGDHGRQPAHADRGEGHARGRRPASGSSSATSPSPRTRRRRARRRAASTSRSSACPRHRASRAPTRCRKEVGTVEMVVGAARRRRRRARPLLLGPRGEERRQAALRHQRVRLPQGSKRAQLQLPRAGGEPRRSERLERPVAHGTADTQPGRVQNIRMTDRGDGSITIAWDKPTTTSRILDYTISWAGSPGRGGARRPGSATPRPAWTTTRRYVFSVKAQNRRRLLGSTPLARAAAAGHADRAPGAGRGRPGVRGQPDQRARLVAGRAPRGPGSHDVHRELHQRHHLGQRARAASSSRR